MRGNGNFSGEQMAEQYHKDWEKWRNMELTDKEKKIEAYRDLMDMAIHKYKKLGKDEWEILDKLTMRLAEELERI
jgi:hypothetical protein